MASLMMYSRSIGPRAARPSPRREKRVRPLPFSWMSTRPPRRSDLFPEQDRPTVPERREGAELVPGIRLGDRLGAVRQDVAREDRGALAIAQGLGVEAESGGEWAVENDEPRLADRSRRHARVEEFWQLFVGMLEAPTPHLSILRDVSRRSAIGDGHWSPAAALVSRPRSWQGLSAAVHRRTASRRPASRAASPAAPASARRSLPSRSRDWSPRPAPCETTSGIMPATNAIVVIRIGRRRSRLAWIRRRGCASRRPSAGSRGRSAGSSSSSPRRTAPAGRDRKRC